MVALFGWHCLVRPSIGCDLVSLRFLLYVLHTHVLVFLPEFYSWARHGFISSPHIGSLGLVSWHHFDSLGFSSAVSAIPFHYASFPASLLILPSVFTLGTVPSGARTLNRIIAPRRLIHAAFIMFTIQKLHASRNYHSDDPTYGA